MGLWFGIACLYSFIAFYYLRKKLFATAEQLNAESLTPADYCVMAFTGQDFENVGDEESMEKEIKDVFEERFKLGN